jgi:cell division septal protein FtsQ
MIRRDGYHRVERDARVRSTRAQAHLERVRSRRAGGASARRSAPSTPRRRRAAALGVGAILGLLWGDALLAAAAGGATGVDVIAVRGARHLSADEVAAATGLAPGAALDDVDTRSVAEQLEDNDWIAAAEAVRMPGGAVVVGIVEREALAAIELGKPAKPYAVDATGSPFAVADRELLKGLPLLSAAEAIAPREPSPQLAAAVQLAYRLPEVGLALPVEVSIAAQDDPEGFALRFETLAPRFVLGREDLDERLDHLARLLARRPAAVAEATSVDLRFADQVVLRNTPTSKEGAVAPGGGSAPSKRGSAG